VSCWGSLGIVPAVLRVCGVGGGGGYGGTTVAVTCKLSV
jgi:hypothetical protein